MPVCSTTCTARSIASRIHLLSLPNTPPPTIVSRHRAVGLPDLLTAVLAAAHHLTVFHHDSDFDITAEVIDFGHEWIPPRGAA